MKEKTKLPDISAAEQEEQEEQKAIQEANQATYDKVMKLFYYAKRDRGESLSPFLKGLFSPPMAIEFFKKLGIEMPEVSGLETSIGIVKRPDKPDYSSMRLAVYSTKGDFRMLDEFLAILSVNNLEGISLISRGNRIPLTVQDTPNIIEALTVLAGDLQKLLEPEGVQPNAYGE